MNVFDNVWKSRQKYWKLVELFFLKFYNWKSYCNAIITFTSSAVQQHRRKKLAISNNFRLKLHFPIKVFHNSCAKYCNSWRQRRRWYKLADDDTCHWDTYYECITTFLVFLTFLASLTYNLSSWGFSLWNSSSLSPAATSVLFIWSEPIQHRCISCHWIAKHRCTVLAYAEDLVFV